MKTDDQSDPVEVRESSLPLNCSDLSECQCLPFLKSVQIAEQSMTLQELINYTPPFLKSEFYVPFYILRDRSLLVELQEFVMPIDKSNKR